MKSRRNKITVAATLTLGLTAITLQGCANLSRALEQAKAQAQEQREERIQAEAMRLESECLRLGFRMGTSEMAQCKLQLQIQERNASALRQAVPPLTERQCREARRFWTVWGCS